MIEEKTWRLVAYAKAALYLNKCKQFKMSF